MNMHQIPNSEALNKAIAQEVRVLLARGKDGKKISQKEIQDAFGWSRARVNRLVNGEQAWGPAELIGLSDYLELDLGTLLGAAKRVAREQLEKAAAAEAHVALEVVEEPKSVQRTTARGRTGKAKGETEGGSRSQAG